MADEDAYIAPWGNALYEFISSDLSTSYIRANTINASSFSMNHASDYPTLPAHIISSNSTVIATPTSDTGSQFLTQSFGDYTYTIRTSSAVLNTAKNIADKSPTTNWLSDVVYNPDGTFTYNALYPWLRSSTATTNYNGAWVEFTTTPNYARTFYQIVLRTNNISYLKNPKEMVILGRNTTSGNWNLIKAFTSTELNSISYNTSSAKTYYFKFTQGTPYTNYRVVFTRVVNNAECAVADLLFMSRVEQQSYHTVNYNGMPMMRVSANGMTIGDSSAPKNANLVVYGVITASSFNQVSQYATATNIAVNSVMSISGDDGTVLDITADATIIKDAFNGAIPLDGSYGDVSGGNLMMEGKLYQMNTGEVSTDAYQGRYLPVLCEQLITRELTVALADTGSNQGFVLVPPARAVSCVLELWGAGGGGGSGPLQLTPSLGATGNAMTGGAGGGGGGYGRIELPHNFLVAGVSPSITGWVIGQGGQAGIGTTSSSIVSTNTTYLGTVLSGAGGDTSIDFNVGSYSLTMMVKGGTGGERGGQNITSSGGTGGNTGSFIGTYDTAVSGQTALNQTGGIAGRDGATSTIVYQATCGGGGGGISASSGVGAFLSGGDGGVPAKPNASYTLISGSNVYGKGGYSNIFLDGAEGKNYTETLSSGSGAGGGAGYTYTGATPVAYLQTGGNGFNGGFPAGGGGGGGACKILSATSVPTFPYTSGSAGFGSDGMIRISWY